ncbi:beta-galactosidase [Lachnospiraceae bacterium KM106-2]|nr:beta-galactosidase [Lachnospiraceae bacterium KM106-2]
MKKRVYKLIGFAGLALVAISSMRVKATVSDIIWGKSLSANVRAVTASGTCGVGETLSWDLTDKILTITGEGQMDDDDYNQWSKYKDAITTVKITDGVTNISEKAFYSFTTLKSIELADSIQSIGVNAFAFSKLTSISLPSQLTKIEEKAFYNSGLTSLEIPGDVVSIGEQAFASCYNLTSVSIPESITTIPKSLFSGCSKLTSISMPDTITSIGDTAFGFCTQLRVLDLPKSVKYIGANAFNGCTLLYSITIPEGVTEIGDYAFYKCTTLSKVTLPNSVTSLGSAAFRDCSNLYSVTLSTNIKELEMQMFYNCINLRSIELPEGMTHVGKSAFYNCNSLTTVRIPKSMEQIREEAFDKCSSLLSISLPEGITSIEYGVFKSCDSLSEIKLPESLTAIDDYAFAGCSSLKQIDIPNQVTTIGENVFQSCNGLTNIDVPNSVIKIGDFAFYRCASLRDIRLSENITEISVNTFRECTSLESIRIPAKVTQIGTNTFDKCTALKSIYLPDSIKAMQYSALPKDTVIFCNKDTYVYSYGKENNYAIVTPEDYSGTCGENATYLFNDEDYSLKIQGQPSDDWIFAGAACVDTILLNEVSYIPNNAYVTYRSLKTIEMPFSLKQCSSASFYDYKKISIRGFNNSYAKRFATSMKIPFESLGDYQVAVTFRTQTEESFLGRVVLVTGMYSDLPIPVRDGYTFDGWYTKENGGEKITADSQVLIEQDHTLYAHWTKNKYVISFESNGGNEPSKESIEVLFQDNYGELPTCERIGYTFDGWYTSSIGGNKVTSETQCEGTAILYAHWSINTYELIYDANGGDTPSIERVSLEYGSQYGELAVCEREHYAFLGWFTKREGGDKVTPESILEQDITVYAHWSKNAYTVTYNANGGETLSEESVIYEYGIPYGKLPICEREGYTFTGWYTKKEDGIQVSADTICKESITLYAHWTKKSYVVTYDANGGETPSVEQVTMEYGSSYGKLPICEREGYTFTGWYTKKEDGIRVSEDTICKESITLYAHWTKNTYVVTYDANGGETPSVEQVTMEYGSSYGKLPICEREGYTFTGWYTKKEDGIRVSTDTICKESITLYAHWAKNALTVIYDANGGGALSIESVVMEHGSPFGTLPTCEREGYTFTGWYTEKIGGTKVSADTICKESVTLYAQWTKNQYVINYDANGGRTPSVGQVTIEYGIQYGTLPTCEREGYTFTGWYTEKTGGTKVSADTICKESVTLYAQWTKNQYVINYDANGGRAPSIGQVTVEYGIQYGTLPTCEREGYTFTGWYTEKTGGAKVSADTICKESVTLYAQWTKNQYVINYDANGGRAPSVGQVTIEYGSQYGTLPTCEREGYTFTGWYTEKTGGAKVSADTICKESVTLYAQWTKNQYVINYDVNGGRAPSVGQVTVEYGSPYGTLPNCEREGYTFTGWYTEKTGGAKVSADTICKESVTLYAQWTKNYYTLSYHANGGKNLNRKEVVLAYGSRYGTLPTCNRKGYTFVGWYTAKNGGSQVSASTQCKGNQQLYARWKKVSVKKVKITKAIGKNKTIKITYGKVIGTKGYEIKYSLKSNMKSAKLTTTSNTSKTINKLKKNTKYYIQVRAYALDSTKNKVYGDWSSKKSIKVN